MDHSHFSPALKCMDASASKENTTRVVIKRCCIGLCGVIVAVGVVMLIVAFVLLRDE